MVDIQIRREQGKQEAKGNTVVVGSEKRVYIPLIC
jgi:hypothetical protein